MQAVRDPRVAERATRSTRSRRSRRRQNQSLADALVKYVTSAARARRHCKLRVPAATAPVSARGARAYRSSRCCSPSSRSRSSSCRSSGCCSTRRGASLWDDLDHPAGAGRASASRSSARCGRHALAVVFGVPLAWVLARARSRAARWCVPSSCCRWCCRRWSAASRCSSPSSATAACSASGSTTGSASSSRSAMGRRAGRDVRGDAVPRDHGRGRAALDGPPLRGRRGQPRRRPVDGVPARDRADDRARAHRRVRRWRGRGRWASSAPRSPSPATSRGARRRMPLAVYNLLESRTRASRSP